MTWLSTLGTGLLAAILGGVVMGFLADRWTVWYRISSFEGASGYFVISQILLGAVLSFFIGVICSRHGVDGATANFGRGLWLTSGWILGIASVLALFTYFTTDHPPRFKGPPPPPPPTDQEIAAARERDDLAKLSAIPPDAPISAWFPFAQPHLSQAIQDNALQALRSRPDFAQQLARTFVDADAELASAALRLIPRFPGLEGRFTSPVQEVGRDLVTRLQKTVAITPEQDPSYEAAAQDGVRFYGWMQAIRHLRQASNSDFTPELRGILVLARKRPDSVVLRDVTRIASFYMKEWAGEEPLPTDPLPR